MPSDDTQKVLDSIQSLQKRVENEFSEIREEMQGGFSEIREEMQGGFSEIREEMQGGFSEIREEMQGGFVLTHERIAKSEQNTKHLLESMIDLHDSLDKRVEKLESEIVTHSTHQ